MPANEVKSILVVRLDVQGDVLVATSILPGLRSKYPNAKIDWYVRTGFGFALENNPYIHRIINGPIPGEEAIFCEYDKVIQVEHHHQWNRPMAHIHCDVAGVPHHKPELYFSEWELHSVLDQHMGKIVVANNAGWKSRTCPNLSLVLHELSERFDTFLQIDAGPNISPHIEHPPLTLRQAAAIMYYSKMYIGIDTVFMHMAVALDKPMALCLGPTGPETQLIPKARFIRPFVHLSPPTPHEAFTNGIQLPQEDIKLMIVNAIAALS